MTYERDESDGAGAGRRQGRYWLVWVAAGCGLGSMLPHVMV